MNLRFADRVLSLSPSASIAFEQQVRALRAEGEDIVGLNVGEAQFPPSSEGIEGSRLALLANKTGYDLVGGLLALRELYARKMKMEGGAAVSSNNIAVSNGSKNVIYNVLQAIINPGDEVVIFKPYWVSFPEQVKLAGGIPRFIDCDSETFRPDLEQLANVLHSSSRVRALIINSPNNPSGQVYPRELFKEVFSLARKFNLWILSDEAYEALIYTPEETYASMITIDPDLERVICIQSFSKSFNMTGFRVGVVCARPELISQFEKIQGHQSGNTCTFSQYGALRALQSSPYGPLISFLKLSLKNGLRYFSFFPILPAGGGMFFFPRVDSFFRPGEDTNSFCLRILKEARVAIMPGTPFGMENHVRISFALVEDRLREASERIKKIL